MTRHWTKYVTIGTIVGGMLYLFWTIGWDIYVALDKVPDNTISEIVLAFNVKHLAAVFVIGLLSGFIGGHLFWPQRVIVKGD